MISDAASFLTATFRHGRAPGKPVFASALAFVLVLCPVLWAATPASLTVVPLTRDLGDPRAPGNVKMLVTPPPGLLAQDASPNAGDFAVYVYPSDLSRDEGMTEENRARGLYLWRDGEKIFVDARLVPPQKEEGAATIRVVYAPDGKPLAEGVAEAACRYASELVDVILAVDISGSMAYNDPRKRRVTAARTFIDMARKGGGIGRVGLITFNHLANQDVPLIPLEQGERLLSVLNDVGANGLTNLDTPQILAMREFSRAQSRRSVVILLTDGKNEGSRYQNTHRECARAGVRLFTVGLTESADHGLLREMAESTDGIYFRAPRDSDLPEIYARLAAELGKRQLLLAERLATRAGELFLPIDATVKRLTVMADAGARIAAVGPGGASLLTGKGLENVHMGRPEPGEWRFTWKDATPGESVVAFFGDTPFFLDVFPPQLRGGRLAVGATLAQGVRPLGGASVWIEPLPGVTAERIELFDDGRHGDGQAGDGVYGTRVDVPQEGPEHFDLTLRASGTAWDKGAFVRQAIGATVREFVPAEPSEEMREPLPQPSLQPQPQSQPPTPPQPPLPVTPPLRRDLDPIAADVRGEVDFGILYPGETGTAEAHITLKSWEPRSLSFALTWDDANGIWPELTSDAVVEPGERTFELEITAPANASPGEYRGAFSVSDMSGARGEAMARVRVGTVTLSDPGEVDLGVVSPGTFAARSIRIAYTADKETPLFVESSADGELSLDIGSEQLAAGRGMLAVEASVSVPLGATEGERFGLLILEAGPARREIPLRWQVKSYVLTVEKSEPVAGLPPTPELPSEAAPPDLPSPEAAGGNLGTGDDANWQPDMFGTAAREPAPAGESPWEKTAEALRANSGLPGQVDVASRPVASGAQFPALPERDDSGGDGFWSAWWVYLLAALLLLLLLLLLLAYILYRLGKSAMARFLLVSALVNLILLAAFIALLGSAAKPQARVEPAVAVRLVEEELSAPIAYTPTEIEMLNAPASAASAAGSDAAEAALKAALPSPTSAAGQGMPIERLNDAAVPAPEEAVLARGERQAAASLDAENGTPLRRRDRRMERNVPTPPLPEMTEPEADAPASASAESARTFSSPLVEEARPEIAETEMPSPVEAAGERRVAQAARIASPAAFAAPSGVETQALETETARLEPMRGRRRARQEIAADFPEPRVEIADPIRDATETAATTAEPARDVPGIEEIRPEPAKVEAAASGRRAGRPLPPEAAPLLAAAPVRPAMGETGKTDRSSSALRATARRPGGMTRRGATPSPDEKDGVPEPANGVSGSASGVASGSDSNAKANVPSGSPARSSAQPAARSGARAGSADAPVAERRFAGVPGNASAPSGASAETDRAFAPSGAANGAAVAIAAAPNALGRGTTAARSDFNTGNDQAASALTPDMRSSRERSGGERGLPQSVSALPGGGSGSKNAGGSPSARAVGAGGNGGGSVGESRFDDMTGAPGLTSGAQRPGVDVSGLGRAELTSPQTARGLPVLFPEREETDWRRDMRRDSRRVVGAAASSMDAESLVMIVGDFSRLPDSASGNLFAVLNSRLARGLPVEARRLAPDDATLNDCLLAALSPEEARSWSDADVRAAATYLADGGHIWMDSARPGDADAFMRRLATAAGGEYGPLDAAHQLSDGERVDALTIGGKLAAVTTYQNWRGAWRYGDAKNGRTLRFLIRAMNYFLSGDAEVGIELDGSLSREDTRIEGFAEDIPERLAGGESAPTDRIWDDFGPATAAQWRLPAWSDPGVAAAASDGSGGRVLKLDLGPAAKGRAAFYRVLTPPADFSSVGSLSMEVYYDGGGDAKLSLTLTVPEGGEWADYETPSVALRKGWNAVRFSPRDPGLRRLSRGTGAFPASPNRIGRLGFFLYRGDPAAALVLLRDIRLHDE